MARSIRIRLAVFAAIALTSAGVMILRYIDLPAMLFGIGHYEVTLQLDRAAGLYPQANVSYRGTVVGQVKSVTLTDAGVAAQLSLNSGFRIPKPVRAAVHSQSAIGEQYVDLTPMAGNDAPALHNGDVIAARDTRLPPDLDALLDAANRGLNAIPQDNLKTLVDETYTAVGGVGPELARLVKGGSELAAASQENLDALLALVDKSKPVLDSQGDSSEAINAWAANVASITGQLARQDDSVAAILVDGSAAAEQGRQLFERLKPTLPLVLANLVGLGQVAVTYQPAIEQLLVLVPQAVAAAQGAMVANHSIKSPYKGLFLDFNLNLNLPPVCSTGFLPPQQQRTPSSEDYPARPVGDLYCRVPQDSRFNVRGARNYPCLTVPGKRAPTVTMCESAQQYVPLNDGYNWKGDPNATLSGQPVPQMSSAPPTVPAEPPRVVAGAVYDPATGAYMGPDGKLYTQADLSRGASGHRTWQSMLVPPP